MQGLPLGRRGALELPFSGALFSAGPGGALRTALLAGAENDEEETT